MRKPFIRRASWQAQAYGERGVTMVLVAVCMVAIIAMAALSIDVVTLYVARQEAQRSADAAALAAARVISVMGITGAADPTTDSSYWQAICGGSTSAANRAATAVALANVVGGVSPSVKSITYSAQGATSGVADCSSLTTAFAINPTVTVQVQSTDLPTLFSRIWSRSANSVSATAAAEAFNPSNWATLSGSVAIPVVPRCVKPWIIPNRDPAGGAGTIVNAVNGQISSPGIRPLQPTGIIGESFTLAASCSGSDCSNMAGKTPTAGKYIPAYVNNWAVGYSTCADDDYYQSAIGGCDTSTLYQCGTLNGAQADLSINPGTKTGDTATATECRIHQPGQDTLDTTGYPYTISSGTGNPIVKNQFVTSSNSIVSLPIFDDTQGPLAGSQPTITVVGFLQVFVDNVDQNNGNLHVHVLNVAGCGNAASTVSSAAGTSPIPIRLITPH